MAGLFHDVERNALESISPLKADDYGSIDFAESSSPNDSFAEVSPFERPRPGYTHPQQHRIIPPSITGHGRLIVAHRVVPYWVGLCLVVGALAWAVWCAIYLYILLGGIPPG